MNQFQRRRALQKSRRSLFALRLLIIHTKGLSRSLGYPYRTWKHTGTCSWSFRLALKRNGAAQAPREEWRVGGLIAPWTKSATVSDGRQWHMAQRQGSPFPFPTNFVSLPKRISNQTATAPEHGRSRGRVVMDLVYRRREDLKHIVTRATPEKGHLVLTRPSWRR